MLFHISAPSNNFFSLVLFGLDLCNIFQYPTGNFPSSTEFREKSRIFMCYLNSGIPISFSGLRRDGKKPDPNAGTESGPRRGCSRMLGTGNFWKNPVPGKWHSERRPLGSSSLSVLVLGQSCCAKLHKAKLLLLPRPVGGADLTTLITLLTS